jgi:hypothetical protein
VAVLCFLVSAGEASRKREHAIFTEHNLGSKKSYPMLRASDEILVFCSFAVSLFDAAGRFF